MRLSVLLLVFCGFAVAAGHSNDIDSGGYGKRAYRINDDSDCQLRIYRVRGFQGKPYIIRSDRGRLRGLEKSVQTLGKCCWALYGRKNYTGRPMLLGSRISMKSTAKWGWRSNRIRSARKLDSCDLD